MVIDACQCLLDGRPSPCCASAHEMCDVVGDPVLELGELDGNIVVIDCLEIPARRCALFHSGADGRFHGLDRIGIQ